MLKTTNRECILGAAMPCHVLPYSALQFFTTPCNSLQNFAIPFGVLQYLQILWNSLQCLGTIFCIIAPACAARLDLAVQASAAHWKTPHCPFSFQQTFPRRKFLNALLPFIEHMPRRIDAFWELIGCCGHIHLPSFFCPWSTTQYHRPQPSSVTYSRWPMSFRNLLGLT